MLAQATIDNQVLKEQFKAFLEEHLADYLAEYAKVNELRLREFSLIERSVRVEEELKYLRELEAERHESLMREICARFEAQQKEMSSGFDLVNTRFEVQHKETNARFEALIQEMNSRFDSQQKETNARFDLINTRFESLLKEMNTRFEAQQKEMNTRFEAIEKRFSFMQWLIASGIAIIALIVAYRPLIS